jgi:hypothetical protein
MRNNRFNGYDILGRNFGVMLFKYSLTKENLLKYYIKRITIKIWG